MSEGALSQNEIDALLQGGITSAAAPIQDEGSVTGSGEQISKIQEWLKSVLNDQLTVLRSNIGESFSLSNLQVQFSDILPLQDEVVYIKANLTSTIQEQHAYILAIPDAQKLLALLMGMEDVEIGEASLRALQETFEQMGSSIANALSMRFGTVVLETVEVQRISVNAIPVVSQGLIYAQYDMMLDSQVLGKLYQVFSAGIGKYFYRGSGSTAGSSGAPSSPSFAMDDMSPLAALGGGSTSAGAGMSFGTAPQQTNIRSVQFPQLHETGLEQDKGNLGLLMDVSMEMTVELGRTRRMVRDILSMGEGTIIELDKVAGEPIDILVNGKTVARGEVVIIDENFGVRVTEIIRE